MNGCNKNTTLPWDQWPFAWSLSRSLFSSVFSLPSWLYCAPGYPTCMPKVRGEVHKSETKSWLYNVTAHLVYEPQIAVSPNLAMYYANAISLPPLCQSGLLYSHSLLLFILPIWCVCTCLPSPLSQPYLHYEKNFMNTTFVHVQKTEVCCVRCVGKNQAVNARLMPL